MSTYYQRTIQKLTSSNRDLINRSFNLGLYEEIQVLKQIAQQLHYLLKSSLSKIDFVSEVSGGNTLLVGEGNLSFSLSLVEKASINPRYLTATVFEIEDEVSEYTLFNAKNLLELGTEVIFEVDATDLKTAFGYQKFDNIIFQFPNVGSREPVEGRNPNYILIRDFLKSAKSQLNEDGKVLIITVNSSYYNGVFHFEEAAHKAGFEQPEIYSFDLDDFPEYIHSMANENESAIEDYDSFCTYVFKL